MNKKIGMTTLLLFLFTLSSASAVTVANFEILELGGDGFVVGWNTDVPTTGQVLYGTSGGLGKGTSIQTSLATEHQVQVSGLQEGTVYFYRVTGKDANGNTYDSQISLTRTYGTSSSGSTTNTNTNTGSSTTTTSSQPVIELTQLKAFPTAQGYGRFSTGGRGGSVIHVTNLNDGGTGSLRAALEASGPRTVVFDVGGTIKLTKHIYVKNDGLYVAGQTAPGDGITITSHPNIGGIQFTASEDVTLRDFRVRKAGGGGVSNLRFIPNNGEVKDVILDRLSLSWPPDDSDERGNAEMNIGLSKSQTNDVLPHEITVQRSIIAESTRGLLMYKGPYHITMYQNYWYANNERNPATNRNWYTPRDKLHFEFVNNIIHNVRGRVSASAGTRGSLVSNKWTMSSQLDRLYSNSFVQGQTLDIDVPTELPHTHFYFRDNIIPSGIPLTNSLIAGYVFNSPKEPLTIGSSNILSASQIDNILPYVGTTRRDSLDTTFINYYKNGNGVIKTTGTVPSYSGGTAPTDTDKDGMPDSFEDAHGLNKNDANDRNSKKATWNFNGYSVKNTAGYTNLEIYLAWKIGDFDMMLDGHEKPDGSFTISTQQVTTTNTNTNTNTNTGTTTSQVDTSFGVDYFYQTQDRTEVSRITSGMTIDLANFGSNDIAIRSFGGKLQTVLYFVNGKYVQTQNDYPVSLNNQFWKSPGTYTITAVPYTQDSPYGEFNALGNKGVEKTITITVVDSSTNTQAPTTTQPTQQSPTTSSNKPTVYLNTLKGFPDLWGEGADEIKGGRGAKKFFITTLSDGSTSTWHPATSTSDGYFTGSFFGAINLKEPIQIIPRVSGNIDVKSRRWIGNREGDFKTYHGHLAPPGGLAFTNRALELAYSDDIIFRFLKARFGNHAQEVGGDAVTLARANNMVVDHSSMGWGGDEIFSIGQGEGEHWKNIISQHNIMHQGKEGHNVGSILGYTDNGARDTTLQVSWHNNVYAGVTHRTPNFAGDVGSEARIYNNIAYGYRWRLTNLVGNPSVDVAYNHFTEDPRYSVTWGRLHQVQGGNPSIYTAFNYVENYEETPDSNDKELWSNFGDSGSSPAPLPTSMFRSSPMSIDPVVGYKPVSAQQAYQELIIERDVGANRQVDRNGNIIIGHDSVDKYYLDAIQKKTDGTMPESQWVHPSIPSNQPYTDNNWNGIYDGFEQEHGITSSDQIIRNWVFDNYNVVNNAGYDAFEMWSAYVAGDFERLAEN